MRQDEEAGSSAPSSASSAAAAEAKQRGSGGSSGGSGGGSGGSSSAVAAPAHSPARGADAPFSKETLKTILVIMVGKFEEHTASQAARRIELERMGKDEAEAGEILQGEFMEKLAAIEKEIGQRFGTNQAALMEAQDKYSADPEIAALMNKMKLLLFGEEQFNAIQEAEAAAAANMPKDMTAEKFAGVMRAHMAALDALFLEQLGEAKRETPNATKEERHRYLDYLLANKVDDVQAKFLREAKLSEDEFKACLIKFGNNRQIMELVMESQMRQEALKEQHLG